MEYSPAVGVLGGMGPRATIAFLDKVVELTPAKKDWEHIRLIVDNNPHIPSRTRHLLFNEPSPVPGMVDSCRRLAAYPVDFIVIPCNSACAFIEEIRPHIEVPIIDIIETTVDALVAKHQGIRSCAVIGGRVTYTQETYRPFLERQGIQYVVHTEDLQKKIDAVIESVKNMSDALAVEEACSALLDELLERHPVDAVILGCTEFGCLHPKSASVPLIDSSLELAKYVVKRAKETPGA